MLVFKKMANLSVNKRRGKNNGNARFSWYVHFKQVRAIYYSSASCMTMPLNKHK